MLAQHEPQTSCIDREKTVSFQPPRRHAPPTSTSSSPLTNLQCRLTMSSPSTLTISSPIAIAQPESTSSSGFKRSPSPSKLFSPSVSSPLLSPLFPVALLIDLPFTVRLLSPSILKLRRRKKALQRSPQSSGVPFFLPSVHSLRFVSFSSHAPVAT